MVSKIQRNEIAGDSYKTAGLGAIMAGVGAKGALDIKTNILARKTVQALNNQNGAECDAFMKKNNKIMSKAFESTSGFFGKLNKAMGTAGANAHPEAVENAGKKTLEEYWTRASEIAKNKFQGSNLKKETGKLRDKLLEKDIAATFRGVTKFSRLGIIAGAVVGGAIAACMLKEVANINNKKNIKKDLEPRRAKEPSKAKETPEEKEAEIFEKRNPERTGTSKHSKIKTQERELDSHQG